MELDEDELSWIGETAVIMHILAIGCVLAGEGLLCWNMSNSMNNQKQFLSFYLWDLSVRSIAVDPHLCGLPALSAPPYLSDIAELYFP